MDGWTDPKTRSYQAGLLLLSIRMYIYIYIFFFFYYIDIFFSNSKNSCKRLDNDLNLRCILGTQIFESVVTAVRRRSFVFQGYQRVAGSMRGWQTMSRGMSPAARVVFILLFLSCSV